MKKYFSIRNIILGSVATIIFSLLNIAPVLACDISITPAQASGTVGQTISFTIDVAQTHRDCTISIEDTQIVLDKMELVSQTPWQEISSSTYQAVITVKLLSEGEGSLTVIRECIKGGGTATATVIIGGAGPVVTTSPAPSPAEPDPPVAPASSTETSWGEAIAEALGQPFVIAYLALTAFAYCAFIKRKRRWRFISLAFSMIYLGFFLGLCPCALGSLQHIILDATDVKAHLAHYLILGIPLVSTLFLGRIYCGWVCPMGAVQQLLYRREVAVKVPTRIHRILKYFRYAVLVGLVIAVIATGTTVFAKIDPFKSLFNMEISPVPTTLLVITLVASLFIFAPWCRYICPLGALLSVFARFSWFKLKFTSSCKNCTACARTYCDYMAIRTGDSKPGIGDLECTRCGECFARCPKEAIVYERRSQNTLETADNI